MKFAFIVFPGLYISLQKRHHIHGHHEDICIFLQILGIYQILIQNTVEIACCKSFFGTFLILPFPKIVNFILIYFPKIVNFIFDIFLKFVIFIYPSDIAHKQCHCECDHNSEDKASQKFGTNTPKHALYPLAVLCGGTPFVLFEYIEKIGSIKKSHHFCHLVNAVGRIIQQFFCPLDTQLV